MSEYGSNRGFRDVDRVEQPQAVIAYLDRARSDPQVQAMKRQNLNLLALHAGAVVLDAGCGTGEDVQAMAERVGPAGCAVGVDRSAVLIDEAQRRNRSRKLGAAFCHGDVTALGFSAGSFDACYAESILTHLPEPSEAVSELVRVAKSGGRVVACEGDAGMRNEDYPDRMLFPKLSLAWQQNTQRDSWLGRRLPRLFRAAGLVEVSVHPFVQVFEGLPNGIERIVAEAEQARRFGVLKANEAREYIQTVERAVQAGGYFRAFTFFCVCGRKP